MRLVSRRAFLGYATVIAGMSVTGVALHRRSAPRPKLSRDPFGTPAAREQQTAAQWMHYQEVARFQCPRIDPRRIACAPDDTLHLAAGRYVAALDAEGTIMAEVALSDMARAVAVSEDGWIYAAVRDHIEVFDSTGRRRATWEPVAGRPWLTGIALGGSDLFVADAGNRVVLRYDLSGKLLHRIGAREDGRASPRFVVPSPYFDVRVARDGLLRVSNPGRHRVEGYTLEGKLEFSWGKTSSEVDGFCGCCNPVSLALLDGERHVTAEKGLRRVKVYGARGSLESVVAMPEPAAAPESDASRAVLDVAVTSRGRIYILDPARNEIRAMEKRDAGAPLT